MMHLPKEHQEFLTSSKCTHSTNLRNANFIHNDGSLSCSWCVREAMRKGDCNSATFSKAQDNRWRIKCKCGKTMNGEAMIRGDDRFQCRECCIKGKDNWIDKVELDWDDERENMNVGDEMIGKHMMPELDKCFTDSRSAEYAKVYDKPKPDTIGTGYHGKGDPTTFTKPSNGMVDVAKDMHGKALNRQNKRLVKENQELKDVIVLLAKKMNGQESYVELQDVMMQAIGKGKGE